MNVWSRGGSTNDTTTGSRAREKETGGEGGSKGEETKRR